MSTLLQFITPLDDAQADGAGGDEATARGRAGSVGGGTVAITVGRRHGTAMSFLGPWLRRLIAVRPVLVVVDAIDTILDKGKRIDTTD